MMQARLAYLRVQRVARSPCSGLRVSVVGPSRTLVFD